MSPVIAERRAEIYTTLADAFKGYLHDVPDVRQGWEKVTLTARVNTPLCKSPSWLSGDAAPRWGVGGGGRGRERCHRISV